MPSFNIRERLLPYRLLAYLLYARPIELRWLESIGDDQVRVTTGEAARDLRMRNAQLWEALFWLRDNQLVLSVEKERKRGSAIIKLVKPTNINYIEKKDE